MTKADIIAQIANETGVDRQTVSSVVESFMVSVQGSMVKGQDVFLRGFGSFTNKKRAEKTARNISKNTTIKIPAHYIPAFKPAKEFVESVRGNVK